MALSFVRDGSAYDVVDIPNLNASIYVTENEHNENYATSLEVYLPKSVIELTSVRPIDETNLLPDTTQGHTLPFSNFRTVNPLDEDNDKIIIPAGSPESPSGAVVLYQSSEGTRIWPLVNKFTKPIQATATKILKYAPMAFNVANKLLGVCKIANGDLSGLANVVNIPFMEPAVTQAEIEAEGDYIITSESSLTDENTANFLPFTTFSIIDNWLLL